MVVKIKSNKPFSKRNFQSGAGYLLLIYVFVFLLPPGLIPHTEHDHLDHLNQDLEADPCHLAIYHPGADGACHHKYHITQGHDNCPLCHITLVRQITPDPVLWFEINESFARFEIQFLERKAIKFPTLHSDRGPPCSSLHFV